MNSPSYAISTSSMFRWRMVAVRYQMEEPGDPSVIRVRTEVAGDDLTFATGAVKAAKAACDVLAVTIHWGFGSGEELAEYQLPLARALVAAGRLAAG